LIYAFDVLMIPVVLIKIVLILVAVAYFTIAERKVMASIQRRLGPNVEGGPFGLLQPLADGLKLVIKELAIPNRANVVIFLLAPMSIFILSLTGWSVIPFYYIGENIFFDINQYTVKTHNFITINRFVSDIKFGILFLLALSSLNVYGIILGG
jgi:NADH-quinone oxidoreductase subunit H